MKARPSRRSAWLRLAQATQSFGCCRSFDVLSPPRGGLDEPNRNSPERAPRGGFRARGRSTEADDLLPEPSQETSPSGKKRVSFPLTAAGQPWNFTRFPFARPPLSTLARRAMQGTTRTNGLRPAERLPPRRGDDSRRGLDMTSPRPPSGARSMRERRRQMAPVEDRLVLFRLREPVLFEHCLRPRSC